MLWSCQVLNTQIGASVNMLDDIRCSALQQQSRGYAKNSAHRLTVLDTGRQVHI